MMKRLLKKEVLLFAAGLAIVMAAALPYIFLGENIVVFFQDQLDGEVPGYILSAKYLFSGITAYPELMNGIPKNGLFPPAPLLVLLYKALSPLKAFVFNQIFCMLIAYAGMYLCLKRAAENDLIAVFCGILFAYLPLLSVYGLCQYGQPLLFYAFYLLYRDRHRALAICAVILYGFMSSLVLIGYAVIGFAGLYLLWLLWRRELKNHKWLLAGWIILLCCYLIVNYGLIFQIFGIGEQTASHKEALVRYGQDVKTVFFTTLFDGTVHAPTHQRVIVVFTAFVMAVGLALRSKLQEKQRTVLGWLLGGFCFNLFCTAFYAFVQSSAIAGFRNRTGGIIKEFQMDRIYWLSVSVWYILFGLGLYLMWEWVKCCVRDKRRLLTAAGAVCMAGAVCLSSAVVYYYSDFNKNLHRLRYGEAYGQVTWKDFYAPDVFSQIDDFIGREKSSYRTLSFGIYPAAPLFNGFYCLDGYSNNYALSYMHEFRDIIKGELEKDASLQKYYDEWGCRCYVLSAELGTSRFMLPKNSQNIITELSIDAGAAKKMGAEYLFSAIEIPNAEELGIKLLRDEPFETADSYYSIYLYGL